MSGKPRVTILRRTSHKESSKIGMERNSESLIMYKPVKFIAKIPYKDFSTYYLFCRGEKTLMPIETYDAYQPHVPSIYNSLKRILVAMGFSVTGIKIYHFCGDKYYTCLTIHNEKNTFDINISFRDGIEIAKETESQIFVKDSILKEYGIKVTKELVQKALNEEQDQLR